MIKNMPDPIRKVLKKKFGKVSLVSKSKLIFILRMRMSILSQDTKRLNKVIIKVIVRRKISIAFI